MPAKCSIPSTSSTFLPLPFRHPHSSHRIPRYPCLHRNSHRSSLPKSSSSSLRSFSSGRRHYSSAQDTGYAPLGSSPPPPPPPRWSQTPPRLTAPVSLKFKNVREQAEPWRVNESQEKLDQFYIKFLGEGGDRLLTEEVKWLAVTHKSFDQGRRGYNDRLAFLGKRLVNLQTDLHILNRYDGYSVSQLDEYEREPFHHPGVDLLPRLTVETRANLTHRARLATFASKQGVPGVLRWKPRIPANLRASGLDQALSQAVYAIIGAVALQRGGEVAVRVVKDRILGIMDLS